MLRAVVEIVPFGIESQKHTLGVIEIINDGTGDELCGNYDVRVDDQPAPWARIENHPRDFGWVALLDHVIHMLNDR